ncbi:LysR family transcriptional regulator [Marivivens niveibacter]|uniref:LysR family transcriptional regulator n=1 Tax=Marivivens niveibacter TaxID=1930667 RepID=A0A251X008_9RHOB|nr:LysR family transcriptional regulator [Marivivens niveibacter]OUD10027.1 LysR family transcriptional regulator [Marivivens niveibacter]
MDIVDELKAFVATAQTGSFTAAAHQLGISNRLTSKYVAELEARLGVRLFQRTTRKVGLTPAGQDLFTRAPALLDDLDDLLTQVAEGSRSLSGVIRISAPVTFGEVYVSPMLGRFSRLHPQLSFDLRLNDTFVDLATDGIDVAFRLGQSDILSLKTRKLGQFHSVAVASQTYLDANGTPKSPSDLNEHTCIIDTNRRAPRRWTFFKDGTETMVNVAGPFEVNSARAASDLCLENIGIAYAPWFAVCDLVRDGKLVPLFQDYESEKGQANIVYLEGRALPRKIRELIEFAVQDIKTASIL